MVKLATLQTLAALEAEMAEAGRAREEAALREVRRVLARTEPELITTGQAAEKLGVSIPTIKRWVARGGLAGGVSAGRWLVSAESVDRVLRLRAALAALDEEGNPTPEEIEALIARSRRKAESAPTPANS